VRVTLLAVPAISIHALVQRAAGGNDDRKQDINFNPRPRAEGGKTPAPNTTLASAFQSTPSCRGRLINAVYNLAAEIISIHALVQRAAIVGAVM